MKCTSCPDLGQRIDYLTFVCNYTGSLLSLDDVNDTEAICPRDESASGSISGFKSSRAIKKNAAKTPMQYTCSICGEKFETRAILSVHRKETHLTCRFCHRTLKTSQARQRHETFCKKREEEAC